MFFEEPLSAEGVKGCLKVGLLKYGVFFGHSWLLAVQNWQPRRLEVFCGADTKARYTWKLRGTVVWHLD